MTMLRSTPIAVVVTLVLGAGLACAGNRGPSANGQDSTPPDAVTEETGAGALEPFLGTWRVNYEASYAFVLAEHDTNDVAAGTYSDYIAKFGGQIKLEIGDSTITYDRGRHHRIMSIEAVDERAEGLALTVGMDDKEYEFLFHFDEAGFLHMLSSRPRFQEMFLYERAPVDWEPSRASAPPGRDGAKQR
jgi:hypothetical protein